MKRLLAVVLVVASGCGGEVSKTREPGIGSERLVYDPDDAGVLCWIEVRGKPEEMTTQTVGSRVQWLGDGYKMGDSRLTRVRFLEGQGKGKVGYCYPNNLRPVPPP